MQTRVMLRVRPFNLRETEKGGRARCLEVQDGSSLKYSGSEGPPACFSFDRVLGEDSTQGEVFEVRG